MTHVNFNYINSAVECETTWQLSKICSLTFGLVAITADWYLECEIQCGTTSELYLQILYENFYTYFNSCKHGKMQKYEAIYTYAQFKVLIIWTIINYTQHGSLNSVIV